MMGLVPETSIGQWELELTELLAGAEKELEKAQMELEKAEKEQKGSRLVKEECRQGLSLEVSRGEGTKRKKKELY